METLIALGATVVNFGQTAKVVGHFSSAAGFPQVLQLAESVYRLNAVGDGEPSSVLDCMQAAIIEAQR